MSQVEPVYAIELEKAAGNEAEAGEKAAALAGMIRNGFNVPSGFVLTRQAFDKFAKANKLEGKISAMMKGLGAGDFQSVREVSERIQNLVINSDIPDFLDRELRGAYEELSVGKEAREVGGVALDLIKAGRGEAWVAVRPSGIGDFMGKGRTVLNARGPRKISDAVKKCWSSLFTPREMLRRRERMVEGFPSMAVVVQKMVDSDKSGVIFTYQPETQDRSRIVIEGIPGLGEAMFELATPDEYVVDKETGRVLSRRIRRKLWMLKRDAMSGETVRDPIPRRDMELDVLSEGELIKLWELALKLEGQNGSHEVSWGMERGRVFLLNSSPIKEFSAPMEDHDFGGEALAEGVAVYPGFIRGNTRLVLGPMDANKVNEGDIMVTRMTSDGMIPVFRKVSGIVTDSGGRTCHAARLARELGTPCIVGTENATSAIKDDQLVEMDSLNGRVYFREPEPAHAPETGEDGYRHPSTDTYHGAGGYEPLGEPRVPDGFTATQVKVNLTLPDMAERARESDGVGLLRAEHLLTESGKHPIHLVNNSPEDFSGMLFSSLESIARTLYPKPVFYRMLDIRSDEFSDLEGGQEEVRESNPILGWHGIRRSLDEPRIIRREIDVLRRLHYSGLNNIAVMLPFITNVEELRRVKGFLDFPVKTGIMIETPASALNVENFCREGIDFVAIGMDDLTQLVLGVDRDNPGVSKLYTELNPAMINLIKHVVGVCRQYGVKTSVCGEIGSDPVGVERLVELGIDSVTSGIDSLEQVREAVGRAEKRILLDRARME